MSEQVRAAVDAELDRLESDLRVLSPAGIERVAWGWDRHEQTRLDAYEAGEKTALRAIAEHGASEDWEQWRSRLFYEIEGRRALVAWKAEHQLHPQHVHKAERAAFGAALGVFARPWIRHEQYATLVGAMAEALPWLLPEQQPAPTGRS